MDTYQKDSKIDLMIKFQPPVGIGCKGKKSIKTLPTIPNKFKTSIEVFDLYAQHTTEIEQDIQRINVSDIVVEYFNKK